MKQRTAFLLAVLILAISGTALAEQRQKLRIVLNEGDSQRYAMSQNQSLDLTMSGMNQKMENSSRIEFVQTVKKQTDDAYVIEAAYERMQSKMNLGGMTLAFDSADAEPSKHPMARLQRYLIGKQFSMTVSRRGEVREVEGFDAIMDGVAEAFADDPALVKTMDAIRSGFDDEAMTGLMQQSIAVYAEREIAEGDSWEQTARMRNSALGELKLASKYLVQGSEQVDGRDCVKLTVSSTIEVDNTGQMFSQLSRLLGGEVDVKIADAAGSGTILVDSATGIIVDSNLQQTIAMEMAMQLPEGEAPAGTMAISASVTQQSRMELLK